MRIKFPAKKWLAFNATSTRTEKCVYLEQSSKHLRRESMRDNSTPSDQQLKLTKIEDHVVRSLRINPRMAEKTSNANDRKLITDAIDRLRVIEGVSQWLFCENVPGVRSRRSRERGENTIGIPGEGWDSRI